MSSFRYLVNDVNESVEFYTRLLGFKLEEQFGPAMAIISKDDFTLWLAGPMSSAAKPMADGQKPTPGGWNRFVFRVENIEHVVEKLKSAGAKFKNEILSGPGGKQILCVDPSGNLVEIFQPN